MNYSAYVGEIVDKRMSHPLGWFVPDHPEQADKDKPLFANDWTTLVDNIQGRIRSMNCERQFGLQYYKGIRYYNVNCEFEGPHTIKMTTENKTVEFITGEVLEKASCLLI